MIKLGMVVWKIQNIFAVAVFVFNTGIPAVLADPIPDDDLFLLLQGTLASLYPAPLKVCKKQEEAINVDFSKIGRHYFFVFVDDDEIVPKNKSRLLTNGNNLFTHDGVNAIGGSPLYGGEYLEFKDVPKDALIDDNGNKIVEPAGKKAIVIRLEITNPGLNTIPVCLEVVCVDQEKPVN